MVNHIIKAKPGLLLLLLTPPNTGISSPLFHRLERRLARPLRAFVRSSSGQTPLREPTVLDEWPTVELHFVFALFLGGWLAFSPTVDRILLYVMFVGVIVCAQNHAAETSGSTLKCW